MSKKIALLVGGMYREFEIAHKSWPFLNYNNIDVFFSTWDKTYEINERLGINIKENVDCRKIKDFIPNARITISEDFSDDKTTISSIKKIIFHWKILKGMMEETRNNYDLIILTRPDMVYLEKSNFNLLLEHILDDSIYGLTPIEKLEKYPHYYVQDCLFISKSHVISRMIDTLDPYTSCDDIHLLLSEYFIKNQVEVKSLHPQFFEYYVARSIHRNLKNISFEKMKEIGLDWWHIKHDNRETNELKNKLDEWAIK